MYITGFHKLEYHSLTVGCTQLQVTHAPQSNQANNKIDWSSLHFNTKKRKAVPHYDFPIFSLLLQPI